MKLFYRHNIYIFTKIQKTQKKIATQKKASRTNLCEVQVLPGLCGDAAQLLERGQRDAQLRLNQVDITSRA